MKVTRALLLELIMLAHRYLRAGDGVAARELLAEYRRLYVGVPASTKAAWRFR